MLKYPKRDMWVEKENRQRCKVEQCLEKQLGGFESSTDTGASSGMSG